MRVLIPTAILVAVVTSSCLSVRDTIPGFSSPPPDIPDRNQEEHDILSVFVSWWIGRNNGASALEWDSYGPSLGNHVSEIESWDDEDWHPTDCDITADLAISLDAWPHLVDYPSLHRHWSNVFNSGNKWVILYNSLGEDGEFIESEFPDDPEDARRKLMKWIWKFAPEFRLIHHEIHFRDVEGANLDDLTGTLYVFLRNPHFELIQEA